MQLRSLQPDQMNDCAHESGHDRRAVCAPLPVTHTSARGDFSAIRDGVVKRNRFEPCSPTISFCTAIMFSMRFSDGVTVRTRKALKPHWRCMQFFFPELVVAEQFSAEARFADELPRLDVHGAAIEFEREIETRAVFEGEAKHTIGNDADGERIACRFERDARMEGRIVVARLFGEIGKEIVMIDQAPARRRRGRRVRRRSWSRPSRVVCARNCAVARAFLVVQSSLSLSGMPASASTWAPARPRP